MRRRILVAIGVVLVVACDHPTSPPPLPPPPGPTVKALTINGRTRVAPGETEAYEALATMTDGTTQIYTAKAQWRSPCPLILPTGNDGKATAKAAGECTITAFFGTITTSLSVMVIPAGTFRVAGAVSEAGLPVAGAAVKVKAGQGAGLQAVTDDRGQYRLYGVAGAVDIEVSKPGYPAVIKTLAVGADELLDFPDLAQTGALPTLSGAYTLTLTTGAHCFQFGLPFPAEVKSRTYSAAVTQDGPKLTVTLSGGKFQIINGRGNQFEGHIEPGGVSFTLGSLGGFSYYYNYYYHVGIPDVAELLSDGRYLSFLGTASGPVTASGISGPISGWVVVFSPTADGSPGAEAMCHGGHQFSLTPLAGATRIRR